MDDSIRKIEETLLKNIMQYGSLLHDIKENYYYLEAGFNSFDEFLSYKTLNVEVAMFAFHFEGLMKSMARLCKDKKEFDKLIEEENGK